LAFAIVKDELRRGGEGDLDVGSDADPDQGL